MDWLIRKVDSTIGLSRRSRRFRIVLGLAAVYVLWGSTFLAIRVAVDSIPPLLMAAARWGIAGTCLYAWTRSRGAAAPRASQWLSALVLGALMVTFSNGGVTWAETRVPSGLAALLVASVSLWMVLFDWIRPGGTHPSGAVIVGLVLGFLGVALLAGPGSLDGHHLDRAGTLVLLLSAISWSLGSIYSPRAKLASPPLLAVAMQMLAGGALLLVVGVAKGELGELHPSRIKPASVAGLVYLVVCGSLIGFTVFAWLMKVASPALVSTYACVNPLVAVFLGWAFAGEPITPRMLVATAVIVGAVALIVSSRAARRAPVLRHRTNPAVSGKPASAGA